MYSIQPEAVASGGAGPITMEDSTSRLSGDKRSDESTARIRGDKHLQVRELTRQNEVLKDLVERLQLELEEAVKREQRYRNRAAKLQAEAQVPVTSTDHVQNTRPAVSSAHGMNSKPAGARSLVPPLDLTRLAQYVDEDAKESDTDVASESAFDEEEFESSEGSGRIEMFKSDISPFKIDGAGGAMALPHCKRKLLGAHPLVPSLDLTHLAPYEDVDGEESNKDVAPKGALEE